MTINRYNNSLEQARAALAAIPANISREDWVRVGMAAHAAGLGFEDFNEWSSQADNYTAQDCRDTWRSFQPGAIKAGTLYYLAKQHGWSGSGSIVPAAPRPPQPPQPPRQPAPGMTAAEVWNRAQPASANHPYALRKGLTGQPLEQLRQLPSHDRLRIAGNSMAGALAVPAYGRDGQLQTLQLIPPQGQKMNLPAHRVEGASFTLAAVQPHQPTYLCEGIGQAWAIWQATGATATCCFGWGNVGKVAADQVQARGAENIIIVPDRGKEEDAQRIAAKLGCTVAAMPQGEAPNFDANDLAQRDGLTALAQLLQAAQHHYSPGQDEQPALVPGSELALAEEFSTKAAGHYRYTAGIGWMRNEGTHWTRDTKQTRYRLAKAVCREAAADQSSRKTAMAVSRANTVHAIQGLAQSDERIATAPDEWDVDPMLLNTPGGVIDLRTGQTVNRKGLLFTQTTSATPSHAPAPIWQRFLSSVFAGDAQMLEFMQRLAGYCITGDTSEQKMFFAHGAGANGKSVFLDTLRGIVGKYAHNLPAEALMTSKHEQHPTMFAALQGKRLAISSEIEDGAMWAESRIKSLTGDDTMTARFMRQDFFEFKVTHKHLIAGNFKPRLKGDDYAMVRRMVLIPFAQRFEGAQRDDRLPQKLRSEYPQILGWMLEGAHKWAQDGLHIPGSILAASREYMAANDDISLWLEECCTVGRGLTTPSSAAYRCFSEWKQSQGEHPGSNKAFSQRLERMHPKRKDRKSNVFEGFSINKVNGFNSYASASNGY